MTDHNTVAWGPTARKTEPHQFRSDPQGWCRGCAYVEDAYAHASEEERRAFDQALRAVALKIQNDHDDED